MITIKTNEEGKKVLQEIFTMANKQWGGDLNISTNIINIFNLIEVESPTVDEKKTDDDK